MKKCFGNFMNYPICENHNDCKLSDECLVKTNKEKGKCDCPYKGSCHTWRQNLQVEFRLKSGEGLESCPFYILLKSMYEERSVKNETKDRR